jgi:hypothetical protein
MGKDNFMDNVAGKFSIREERSGKGILLGHLATMYTLSSRVPVFNTRMYKGGLGKCLEIELIKLTKTHLGQTILQHNIRTCRRPSCHSHHYRLIAVLGP